MRLWRNKRLARGLTPAKLHIGTAEDDGVDSVETYLWPGMNHSGSSGLFAVKVLMDRGYDRIVLAGVPMDAEAAHFFNPAKWDERNCFWQAWLDQKSRLNGIVKSMSGATRAILGAPDAEWLGGISKSTKRAGEPRTHKREA